MPRESRIKKGTANTIRISAAVVAWIALGWSNQVFSLEPASAAVEAPSISQMRLAPIVTRFTLNGNLGYTFRRDTVEGFTSSSQTLIAMVTPGISAQSYIWQPWFAQVSGALGFNIYGLKSSNAYESYTIKNNSLAVATIGNLTLKLVPASRFPFTAYFNRVDNRQNVNLGLLGSGTSYQNTDYGLEQHYRTLDGRTNYYANYNHSLAQGMSYSENRRDYSSFNMTTDQFQNQSISLNVSASLNQNPGNGERVRENTLLASHTYQPGNGFSLANLVNAAMTDYHLTGGSLRNSFLQLNSFGSWQSDERPLIVAGSALLKGAREENSAWDSNTNANLSVSYSLSQYFRVYGSVNVNDTDGVQTVSTTQSAIASYSPRPIDLGGGLKYTRTATATLTNSTAPSHSQQSFAASLGHGLNRSSAFANGILSSSVNQTISASVSRPDDTSSPRLQHNGMLSWDKSDVSGATYLRLTADDSHEIGGKKAFFQLLNLQANRSEGLTRSSSLNGNLTTQWTRQAIDTDSARSTTDSSGSLSYKHQRAFDIPRLLFSSELRVVGTGFVPVVSGPTVEASRSWSNSLNYSIGRILTSLTASLSKTRQITYSTLAFNINRAF